VINEANALLALERSKTLPLPAQAALSVWIKATFAAAKSGTYNDKVYCSPYGSNNERLDLASAATFKGTSTLPSSVDPIKVSSSAPLLEEVMRQCVSLYS